MSFFKAVNFSSTHWSNTHWSNTHWSNTHWSNTHWSNTHWSNTHWSELIINIKLRSLSTVFAMLGLLAGQVGLVEDAFGQEVPPPTLKASVRSSDGKGKISWSFPYYYRSSSTVIEIIRAPYSSGRYATVKKVVNPKNSYTIFDKLPAAGKYKYKGRLKLGSYKSKWSSVKVIDTSANSSSSSNNPAVIPNVTYASGQTACPSSYFTRVLELVNIQRQGLTPLSMNTKLLTSSQRHTVDMARYDNLSHDGWIDYITAAGYDYCQAAENIALGYTTPEAVMDGWMNSSGHRTNILNPNYTELGVGCVIAPDGRIWWTQNFGRPCY